ASRGPVSRSFMERLGRAEQALKDMLGKKILERPQVEAAHAEIESAAKDLAAMESIRLAGQALGVDPDFYDQFEYRRKGIEETLAVARAALQTRPAADHLASLKAGSAVRL